MVNRAIYLEIISGRTEDEIKITIAEFVYQLLVADNNYNIFVCLEEIDEFFVAHQCHVARPGHVARLQDIADGRVR